MKKQRPKRFPLTRQIIREWSREACCQNIGNPDPEMIPSIKRMRNQAYKELRESR